MVATIERNEPRSRRGEAATWPTLLALALLSSTWLAPGALRADPRAAVQFGRPALLRGDFNRLAAQQGLPLSWVGDLNGNGLLDPSELEAADLRASRARYVRDGAFTPQLVRDYQALVEARRRELVRAELDRGRPVLVLTDLRQRPAWERALVGALVSAAESIETLHGRQSGAAQLTGQLARADAESRALFARNHGPWCSVSPGREDPCCNALPSFPERRSESYPLNEPQGPALCRLLEQAPNAAQLLAPFVVVRRGSRGFTSLPYPEAFAPEMRAVATELRRAAAALNPVPGEQALRAYLLAAAAAFGDNDWGRADAAWLAMTPRNSQWYLRVAPDEPYQDLCRRKAAFHLVLGRVDQRASSWLERLAPLRQRVERALATLVGAPYTARDVAFDVPEFIHVALNAGDSRYPLGATIGQSLPNWSTPGAAPRRRTIVVTNLYTDTDSLALDRRQASELLSRTALQDYTSAVEPALLVTLLHEASHNVGPHPGTRSAGQAASERLGPALATLLEELKAQLVGIWALGLLREQQLISGPLMRQVQLKAVLWALGHLARGVRTPDGEDRPYGQVAALQLGHLREARALLWEGGRVSIDLGALQRATQGLLQRVARLLASGERDEAEALRERYLRPSALAALQIRRVEEVLLDSSRVSFRYAIVH
jgi:hypothetical protein